MFACFPGRYELELTSCLNGMNVTAKHDMMYCIFFLDIRPLTPKWPVPNKDVYIDWTYSIIEWIAVLWITRTCYILATQNPCRSVCFFWSKLRHGSFSNGTRRENGVMGGGNNGISKDLVEPRKKNLLLSIESWFVNRDPYNGFL